MQASFGSSIRSLFGQQYTLSIASPSDGCKAFNNTGNVAGTVVLVLRGSCFFAVKVRHKLPPLILKQHNIATSSLQAVHAS